MTQRPNLFLDFSKNQPSSLFIFKPFDDEEPTDEETKTARDLFVDQVLNHTSVSLEIVKRTNWAIIMRPLDCLPEIDGKKDVHGFDWYVGHYDWESVVTQLLELSETHKDLAPYSIYIVPTLGQSLQGSKRHELTYNAFIAPTAEPPFDYLIQRPESAEEKDVDEELYKKADTCVLHTLKELNMEWTDVYTLRNSDFDIIKGTKEIPITLLGPTRRAMTQVNRKDFDFASWYDCVMGNFLPLIPYPQNDAGKYDDLPLVMMNPIECTPPAYKKLIDTCLAVNALFDDGIKNIIKYWQIDPVGVAGATAVFIAAGNQIPERSKEFNQLFFPLFTQARQFIVDDIFNEFLKIKRRDDEELVLYRGVQADVYAEMDSWDTTVKKLAGDDEAKVAALAELKTQIDFWFEQANVSPVWNEFKESITTAMIASIDESGLKRYLEVSDEENKKTRRHEWLALYKAQEVSFTLWPTIYRNYEVVHDGEPNPMLQALETEELNHAHCTLIDVKGKVLPPKNK